MTRLLRYLRPASITALLLLVLAIATHTTAQTSSYWFRTLGTSTSNDYGYSVAVDPQGSIYIVGSTDGNGFVAKLSSDGSILWSKLLSINIDNYSLAFSDVVADSSGVYIVGSGFNGSAYIAIVLKLDGNGNIVWLREFGGQNYLPWGFNGVALAGGYVYAVGVGPSNFTWPEPDALVVKLNATTGDIVWAITMDISGSNDYALDVAVDSSGNLYVVGGTIVQGDYDAFIAKLNSAGGLQNVWVGGAKGLDSNEVLVSVSEGGGYVYACGYAYDRNGNVYSSLMIGFDSSLTPVWTKNISNIVLNSLTANSTRIYAVGETSGDILIALFASNGTLLGSWKIGGGGNDTAYSVTFDSWGTILISGSTTTWSVGGYDAFAASLVPQANLVLKWENVSWNDVIVESASIVAQDANLLVQNVNTTLSIAAKPPSSTLQLQAESWDPATYIAVYQLPQQTTTTTQQTTLQTPTQTPQRAVAGAGGGRGSLGGVAVPYPGTVLAAIFVMLALITITTLWRNPKSRA